MRERLLGQGITELVLDPDGMAGRGQRTLFLTPGAPTLLVDESYNANPMSMAAALGALEPETAA
jgi:UDP-N-acetylmuramyl pentapeptide synthase